MKLTAECAVHLSPNDANIVAHMGYASQKLWNVANYERRNWVTLGLSSYPDWYTQKAALKDDIWFKNLPSQSAQELLKRLDKAWKSFDALKQSGGIQNPNPPRFKHENMPVVYMQNGIVHDKQNRTVRFTIAAALRSHMKSAYNIDARYIWIENALFGQLDNIKQIVLYPPDKNGEARMLIIYEVPDVPLKPDNDHYLAIDLGLHNLMTCFDSQGETFIMGREYLSLCRLYDKEIGKVQSQWYGFQAAQGVKYPKSSGHIRTLYDRKNHRVKDYLHKVTTHLADYCAAAGISKVIIGDWTGIRNDTNFGHKTNQKLHGLPFAKIREMLRYKLALRGIELIVISEAYSSRCSPLAPRVCKKYAEPKKRVKRGLYKDGGKIWNADAVGAFNIMRLWLQRDHPNRYLDPALLGTPTVIKVAV